MLIVDPWESADRLFRQRMPNYTPTVKTILPADRRIYMGCVGECYFVHDFPQNYILQWNRDWGKKKHDGGFDFIIPVGSVDVKTNADGDLWINRNAKIADIYVVYWIRWSELVLDSGFSGWISGENAMKIAKLSDRNNIGHENWFIPRIDLCGDLEKLIQECDHVIHGQEEEL